MVGTECSEEFVNTVHTLTCLHKAAGYLFVANPQSVIMAAKVSC